MAHPPTGRTSADIRAIPLLSDRAYERIRHDIISCVLAPGSEISETQLCAQYKIGKAPVRMALNRLAHDGLVRAIPRRGYRVTPVTVKDIHDVFELRLMLARALFETERHAEVVAVTGPEQRMYVSSPSGQR